MSLQHYSKDPEKEEYFDIVGLVEVSPYQQWKQVIEDKFGANNVTYREVGANGWDRLNIVNGIPTMIHHTGPHWTDAIPCCDNPLCGLGKLLGMFNHNNDIGTYYFSNLC